MHLFSSSTNQTLLRWGLLNFRSCSKQKHYLTHCLHLFFRLSIPSWNIIFFTKLNILLYSHRQQKQAAGLLSLKSRIFQKKTCWLAFFESMAAKRAMLSKRAIRAFSLNVCQAHTVLFFSILSKKESQARSLCESEANAFFERIRFALAKRASAFYVLFSGLEENKN